MLCSPLLTAVLLLTVSAAAGLDCPSGNWKPYGDACFTTLPLLFATQAGATAACLAAQPGATLPSVHSDEQNWFLQNLDADLAYTDIWLGLSRVSGGELVWQDGSPVDFTNWVGDWLGDEPDNTGDCVYMDYFTAQWRDINCATAHFYVVCQYTP